MENELTSPQPENPTSSEGSWKEKVKRHKKKLIILVIIFAVLLLLAAILAVKQKSVSDWLGGSQSGSGGNYPSLANKKDNAENGQPIPEQAIAKVGAEYIFKTDLDYELSFQPGEKTEALKQMMKEKLVKDSIVLQAAEKEGLIKLGGAGQAGKAAESSKSAERVFNLAEKDYGKRISLIKSVQASKQSNADQISGTMISVWFYNMFPAKIGFEKGKQEALKRITALHSKVVSGQITIEQAGDSIKKDPTYEDLDFGYMNNAIVPFSMVKGKAITVDAGFDQMLWKTNPGQVTDIFLGKDTSGFSGKLSEAFYIFAKVDAKNDRQSSQDFESWYQSQKNNYQVTTY